jgi:amino acid permease
MKQADATSKLEPVPLRRVLNLREAVALGIGGTIGGGIFVLVGTHSLEAAMPLPEPCRGAIGAFSWAGTTGGRIFSSVVMSRSASGAI